jgi:hypothetical protein
MSQFSRSGLTPQARPVDTFKAPLVAEKATRAGGLADLARGLSGFNAGLSTVIAELNQENEAEERRKLAIQVEADAVKFGANVEGFDQAVKDGLIQYQDVPWAMDSLKGLVAHNRALSNLDRARPEFLKNPHAFKTSEEVLAHFQTVGAEGLDPDDPVVVAGAADAIRQYSASAVNTWVMARSEARKAEMVTATRDAIYMQARPHVQNLDTTTDEELVERTAALAQAIEAGIKGNEWLPDDERNAAIIGALEAATISVTEPEKLSSMLMNLRINGEVYADTVAGRATISRLVEAAEQRAFRTEGRRDREEREVLTKWRTALQTDQGSWVKGGRNLVDYKIPEELLKKMPPQVVVQLQLETMNIQNSTRSAMANEEGRKVYQYAVSTSQAFRDTGQPLQGVFDVIWPETGETLREALSRTSGADVMTPVFRTLEMTGEEYAGLFGMAQQGLLGDVSDIPGLSPQQIRQLMEVNARTKARIVTPGMSHANHLMGIAGRRPGTSGSGTDAASPSASLLDIVVLQAENAKRAALEPVERTLDPQADERIRQEYNLIKDQLQMRLSDAFLEFSMQPVENQTPEAAEKLFWNVISTVPGLAQTREDALGLRKNAEEAAPGQQGAPAAPTEKPTKSKKDIAALREQTSQELWALGQQRDAVMQEYPVDSPERLARLSALNDRTRAASVRLRSMASLEQYQLNEQGAAARPGVTANPVAARYANSPGDSLYTWTKTVWGKISPETIDSVTDEGAPRRPAFGNSRAADRISNHVKTLIRDGQSKEVASFLTFVSGSRIALPDGKKYDYVPTLLGRDPEAVLGYLNALADRGVLTPEQRSRIMRLQATAFSRAQVSQTYGPGLDEDLPDADDPRGFDGNLPSITP